MWMRRVDEELKIKVKPVCYVCGDWMEDAATHLRRMHNGMTVEQYLELHPKASNEKQESLRCGKKIRSQWIEDLEHPYYTSNSWDKFAPRITHRLRQGF